MTSVGWTRTNAHYRPSFSCYSPYLPLHLHATPIVNSAYLYFNRIDKEQHLAFSSAPDRPMLHGSSAVPACCHDRNDGVTSGELPPLLWLESMPSLACIPPPMSSSAAASCGSQTPSVSIWESSAVSSSSASLMYSCLANLQHHTMLSHLDHAQLETVAL